MTPLVEMDREQDVINKYIELEGLTNEKNRSRITALQENLENEL